MSDPLEAYPAVATATAPARRGLPAWAIVLIIVGSVAVLTPVVIIVLGLVIYISTELRLGAPDQPLMSAEPVSPEARVPLECETPCFDETIVESLLSTPAALRDFDLTETPYPFGTYEPTTAGELYRAGIAGWRATEGGPDECFFVPGNSPIAPDIDDTHAASADPIIFMGTHVDQDQLNALDQSVRIFASSDDAEAFLGVLASNISECTWIWIGSGRDYRDAAVDPQPSLSLPDSVASVGWIRTGEPGVRWRSYVIDLQHGNLVVRTRLLTDGSVTQQEFLTFVEEYAERLAEAVPAAG
jgi:hypothetical protein